MPLSREQAEALSALCRSPNTSRQTLLAVVEELSIAGVTKKDSTLRLRDKVQRWLAVQDKEPRSEHEIKLELRTHQAASSRRAADLAQKLFSKGRLSIAVACLALCLAGTLAPRDYSNFVVPSELSRLVYSRLNDHAAYVEDAAEEVRNFAHKWVSPRRQHVATLVLAGEADLIAMALDALTTVRARVLRRPDFDRDTFRNFVDSNDDSPRLILFENVRSPPIYAEDLVDPYRADPRLRRTAVVFAFEPQNFDRECGGLTGDGPSTARALFQTRFTTSLPPAFYNRLHHAALLCRRIS